MRGWSLRAALTVWTLTLLVAVVVALVAVAARETARLARSEALARAERIAARGLDGIARDLDALANEAGLLAERPTLAQAIAAGDTPRLAAFLARYRATAQFGGIALRCPSLHLIEGDASDETAERTLDIVAGALRGRASASGPGDCRVEVVTAIEWSAEASAAPELRLRLITRAEVDAAVGGARVAIWRAALADGARSGEDPDTGSVLGARRLPGDPAAGLLEVEIPRAEALAPVRRFVYRLGAAAAGIGLVALVAASLLARRLARPVRELTEAARPLGVGNLFQPLPVVRGGEVESLATTLEAMRRSLATAYDELEKSRAELRAVLEGVSDGVFAVDRARRVRYLSPRAAELLGVEAGDAVGRFCGDLLRPMPVGGERPCERACPILEARFRGPVRGQESLEAGGHPWLARLTSAPPTGGLQVQILRPETTEEAARRARDGVVADLAHELKTPLAAQSASLELLGERLAATDPAALELLATIETGSLRLVRLIDNLLESVRIESGEVALRRLPVDLEEVIEEAVGSTAPLAARRSQRLEVDLPFPLPALVGDPQRLTQVLVNLLANAVKFAPEGSEIRLGGAVDGASVRLWVEDCGPGLDPAVLAAGGGRFRRGGAGEPREEGSGLGLWISRSIAERHGGELFAERLDGRTRVTLRLPAGESTA